MRPTQFYREFLKKNSSLFFLSIFNITFTFTLQALLFTPLGPFYTEWRSMHDLWASTKWARRSMVGKIMKTVFRCKCSCYPCASAERPKLYFDYDLYATCAFSEPPLCLPAGSIVPPNGNHLRRLNVVHGERCVVRCFCFHSATLLLSFCNLWTTWTA